MVTTMTETERDTIEAQMVDDEEHLEFTHAEWDGRRHLAVQGDRDRVVRYLDTVRELQERSGCRIMHLTVQRHDDGVWSGSLGIVDA